jgi:hypothetical protein
MVTAKLPTLAYQKKTSAVASRLRVFVGLLSTLPLKLLIGYRMESQLTGGVSEL